MTGSYLLHNNLHYNGLMTDLGLRSKTSSTKRGEWRVGHDMRPNR